MGKSKPSSSNIVNKIVWNVIWGLVVPSKIKKIIWRVCNNALPVGDALWRRNVIESHVCAIFNKKVETIEHMLLLCEWTRGFWFEGCCGMKIEKIGISSFDKWLLGVIKDFF